MRLVYLILICFMISMLIIPILVPRVGASTGKVYSGDVGTLVENKELCYGDYRYVERLFRASGSTSFIFDVSDDYYTGFSITPKLTVAFTIKRASRRATIRFSARWHSPATFYIKATLEVSTDGGNTWIKPDPDVKEGRLSEFTTAIDVDVPPGDSSVLLGGTGDALNWSWDREIKITHVRVNIEYWEIAGYITASIYYLSYHVTYYKSISASATFLIVLSEGGKGEGGGEEDEGDRKVDIEVVADDQDTHYPLKGIKVTAVDPYGNWRYDDYTNETGFVHFERSVTAWRINVSLQVDEVFYGIWKRDFWHYGRYVVEYRRWRDWEWVVDDPVWYKKEGVCWIEWRMGIGYVWLRSKYTAKGVPELEEFLDGAGEGRLLGEFSRTPLGNRRIMCWLDDDSESGDWINPEPLDVLVADTRTDRQGYFQLSVNSTLLESYRYLLVFYVSSHSDQYTAAGRIYRVNKLSIRILDITNSTPVENYPVVVNGRIKYSDIDGYVHYYTIDDTYTMHIPESGGYRFIKWGDGLEENPRALRVSDDITLVAYVGSGNYTRLKGQVQWTPPYGWFMLNFTEKGMYTISLESVYTNATEIIRAVLLDPDRHNITYAELPLRVEVLNSTVLPPEGLLDLDSTRYYPRVVGGQYSGWLLLGLCALEPLNENDLSELSTLLVNETTYAIFNLTVLNLNTSRAYIDTLVISPLHLEVLSSYDSKGVTIEFYVEYSHTPPPELELHRGGVGHILTVALVDDSGEAYFEGLLSNSTTTIYLKYSELMELFIFKQVKLGVEVYWRGIEKRAVLVPLTRSPELEFIPIGLSLLKIEENMLEVEVVSLIDNTPQSVSIDGTIAVYINGTRTTCDIVKFGSKYRVRLPSQARIGRGEIELYFIPEPSKDTVYYVYPMRV